MKKLVSLLLALALVFAVAVASASTITISRDSSFAGTNGRVYTAYKVFDADVYLDGENTTADTATVTYDPNGPIAYTMANDSPWASIITTASQNWFDVKDAADGSKKIVTMKNNVSVNTATAQAIATWLKNNKPADNLIEDKYTITPGGGAVTVDKGYYLILANDGATNLTLVTADVEIHEKNTYITTTKTSAQTDYNVGDTITYTATVTIPADTNPTNPVILHDTMDAALKFGGSATAKIRDIGSSETGTNFTGFTLEADAADINDSCTFEINIPVDSTVLGKEIIFTYTAEVTSAAATETGLVNTIFGQHGEYTTTPVNVYDYTFGFDFEKTFVGSDETSLTAHFELRTDKDDPATAIFFNAKANGIQKKVDTDDGTGSKDLVISNKETINLAGLDHGIYYLVETQTSDGYNLLDGAVKVTITDTTSDPSNPSRTVSYEVNGTTSTGTVSIENKSGTVLPSTGGIGTTIFYILGGLLVVGAAVILVARRKADN